MEIPKYDGRTGGKFCKRPLRRFRSTPSDSPPSAARGTFRPLQANRAGGSRWFSRFVDQLARVIASTVSCFLSFVFGKGLAIIRLLLGLLPALSLAATPGESTRAEENISTIEEVTKEKSSIEAREQGGNSVDIKLSIHYDGSNTSKQELLSHIDAIFQLEQLLDQKRLSRIEINHLEELLHSRTTTPSTLPLSVEKNKEKINNDSSTNPILSHQEANDEKERGRNVYVHEEGFDSPIEIARAYMPSKAPTITPFGVGLQSRICHKEKVSFGNKLIHEDGFDSPIEIATAYMGSKAQKITSFGVGLQSKICHKEKVSFGNKLVRARIASKSGLCFPISEDSRENYKAQTAQEKSKLFEFAGPPYGRSSMFTNPRVLSFQECNPYKARNIVPTRTFKWTTSPKTRHFGLGQALKRGRSAKDARCFHDACRVRQKFCFNGKFVCS